MRILVIEDDARVADALQQGLRATYAVDAVHTAKAGLAEATATSYDVILLDLNLPDKPGEHVCRQLRENGNTTPIIVLTGRDITEDKVALLDMGADDYVIKPFKLEEIQARIRVAMRHAGSQDNDPNLRVGQLVLDPAGRSVTHKGTPITLRRKEFDLLEYMMRHAAQTLTRAMILNHVWETNENLWANVVDVHIKHLRDKIDRPFSTNLIRTVHGVGYKIEALEEGL